MERTSYREPRLEIVLLDKGLCAVCDETWGKQMWHEWEERGRRSVSKFSRQKTREARLAAVRSQRSKCTFVLITAHCSKACCTLLSARVTKPKRNLVFPSRTISVAQSVSFVWCNPDSFLSWIRKPVPNWYFFTRQTMKVLSLLKVRSFCLLLRKQ